MSHRHGKCTEERVASQTLEGREESDYLSFDYAVIANISALNRSIVRCRRILKKDPTRIYTYIELAAESTEWRHPRARRKREEEEEDGDGDRASARRGGKRRRRRVGSSH